MTPTSMPTPAPAATAAAARRWPYAALLAVLGAAATGLAGAGGLPAAAPRAAPASHMGGFHGGFHGGFQGRFHGGLHRGGRPPRGFEQGPGVYPHRLSAHILDQARFAIASRPGRIGMIVAPVMLNGRGPFRFMIDTGATCSILSHQAAQTLDLKPTKEGINIPYGNGALVGNLAIVPNVTLGQDKAPNAQPGAKLSLRNAYFIYPSTPETNNSTPHVLGMNILAGCNVLLDFPGLTLTLQPLNLQN